MEVKFLSAALSEAKKAASYYEEEVEGLGHAFLQKLREGVFEINQFPYACRIIGGNFRRHLLARFPYGIVYRIEDNVILIVAIMHLKRKPGYWKDQ